MTQDPLIVSPTAPPQARTTRFGRVRRWLTGRRGGSVLILVVALLVLLALIGTAFITTAGADRDSSTQHVYNTEIDLLVAGTKNLAVRQLTTSVLTPQPPYDYRTPAFPPGTPSFHSAIPKSRMTVLESTAPNYGKPWLEYSNVDYAPWNPALADRYPARPPGAPGSPPEWRYISANPLALTQNLTTPTLLYTDPPPQWVYGSPPTPATFTLPQFSSPFVGTDVNGQVIVSNYSSRARMQPWYATVKVNNVTRIYPAFKINDPNDPNFGKIVLAADADGDGIPDAGYFELPVGQINGLRYFAGFRVIDNNSALNVSVAWENFRNAEPNDALLPTDVFPTNVDLRRMVEGLYTAKGDSVNDVGPDPDPNPSVVNDSPFDKLNFRRFGATSVGLGSDGAFTYATRFDALWGQLGARLDNPSFNSSAGTKFAPLGVSESVALARRFCLSDPTGSAGGVVENLLPGSFRMTSVVRQPFQADQAFGSASSWFESIFDYDNPAFSRARTPLRPMVTAYNPVTNYTPGFIGDPRVPLAETEREGKYQFRGDWPDSIDTFGAKKFAPPTYHVGDWVTYKGKGYVCIRVHNWASLATDGQPITSGQTYNAVSHPPAFVYSSSNDRPPPGNPQLKNAPPQGTPDFAYWAEAPWISQTVKTNINTASFGQLFAAYMNIMGDAPMTYPGGTPMTAPEVTGGYPGNQYWSFGNVRRPTLTVPVVPPMNSKQSEAIRQLRAAIAAVNTIDLRDQDEDVTSRSIVLTDVDGNEIYRTSVYGSERQPYLTESIVHIPEDESKHYVAIELFNPSPLPLKLDAFRLYYRGRDPTTDGTLTLIRDLRTDDKEIPPFGYLYIENSKANRPDDMTTVKGTDVYAGKTVIEVPLLEEVLKHGGTRELYLLRTRRFDGTVTSNDVGVPIHPTSLMRPIPWI